MIRLEQIEKDNKLIYDMNEKNDLNEDQLNDLKVLNVDEILMEGDPIDSEQLDWVFGDIGRNNENIIETKMDEDVREEEEVVDDFGSILLASAKKKKEESKPKKVVEENHTRLLNQIQQYNDQHPANFNPLNPQLNPNLNPNLNLLNQQLTPILNPNGLYIYGNNIRGFNNNINITNRPDQFLDRKINDN